MAKSVSAAICIENNEIMLETDHGMTCLPFDSVEKAKLVMTDELIKKQQVKKV
jgi:hypothetical protein